MKKAVKIPLIVVGCLAALLLAASLALPLMAKNYVEKHDKELIGRELSIRKLSVNPLFGSARINDVTLFEDDGTTAFVSFKRLKLKINLLDLFKHRLDVEWATITDLTVNVEQNQDWFNFNSLHDFLASKQPKSEPKDSYGLIFNDIRIENGTIRYADLALGNEFLLRDIFLLIPSIDLSELKTDVGLDLAFSDEATLHTDLRLSDNAKKYFVNLRINNLGVEVIEPYLQRNCPVDVQDGRVSLNLEAQGQTEHLLDFDLKGDLSLKQLALLDAQGSPLGSLDSIFVKVNHFSLNDRCLDLGKLYLSGLKTAYVVGADSLSNFDLVLGTSRLRNETGKASFSDTIAIENEQYMPWNVSISELELKDGALAYEDHTLPEVFQYEISGINISSKRFTLDGNNSVQLQAAMNKVGKLSLNWQGRLDGSNNHNLTLMLNNVKVADFSPYTVQLFGFPVENGTLSLRSQNIVSDGNIYGINKLQLAGPKIGDKVRPFHPRYAKVPLKLGLYLLADHHNNVSLDLPISGNLNDPDFSYRNALAKVFSNLLTKVAASPFRLLTDEDNNLKYIPFDPLQLDFSPEQYVMIDNVAATLQSRADLGIVLEEQVQYDEAIKELCVMQLQRDYYLSSHPEKKSSEMDFITTEAIRSIKLNDKGLCDFAAQYSAKKRLHSAKDVTSVACAVYQKESEVLLPKLMAKRNEMLSDYLLNVKGLSPEQISVTTIDASLLKSFKKSSRYEMHVLLYEDLEE